MRNWAIWLKKHPSVPVLLSTIYIVWLARLVVNGYLAELGTSLAWFEADLFNLLLFAYPSLILLGVVLALYIFLHEWPATLRPRTSILVLCGWILIVLLYLLHSLISTKALGNDYVFAKYFLIMIFAFVPAMTWVISNNISYKEVTAALKDILGEDNAIYKEVTVAADAKWWNLYSRARGGYALRGLKDHVGDSDTYNLFTKYNFRYWGFMFFYLSSFTPIAHMLGERRAMLEVQGAILEWRSQIERGEEPRTSILYRSGNQSLQMQPSAYGVDIRYIAGTEEPIMTRRYRQWWLSDYQQHGNTDQ